MPQNTLIIVESPTKARTISKFLGTGYAVKSSFGHIRDLPEKKIGVDIEHNFEPQYVIPAKAQKTITELKEAMTGKTRVVLATDEDREGEAIAWHLVTALGLKESDAERIVFHEITKGAIAEALEHPRKLDRSLVDAQQARRVLDRLVGYKLSPFLWKKIRMGLSAGRVQSVAVRLVVEREREIQAFKAQEYWSVEADLTKTGDNKIFRARLVKINDKIVGKMDLGSQNEAEAIVTKLKGAHYIVAGVIKKEVTRNPAPPFTTSTLQQEAARKLGFSAKQTMTLAQKLYETGVITYMRTDSVNLAAVALAQAQEVIKKHFGPDYVLTQPRYYTNKSKGAQEAHEAIRPTNLALLPDDLKRPDAGQKKLYELIWKRTIACQMQPATLDHTTVDIDATGGYQFRATGQIVKFDGFIRAYTEGRDEDSEEELEGQLPELNEKDNLDLKQLLPIQHFTEPPARYTDATLIKALESHGIGRPSTYAPTLATVQDRGYVEKEDKKYKPTEIGILVNDMLVENFPEIVDINFTAQMEESLDSIAEGKLKWVPVIEEFYTPFAKHLKEKEATVQKVVEESTTPCPTCGKLMIVRFGRMGKFLACPDKECSTTMPLPEEAAKIKELEEKTKDEHCPICTKPMQVKRGRFGYFLGCQDYPKCKGIAKIWNKTGFKCPNCQIGDVVERKGRGRSKPFYGCTRYPDCTFIANKKPTTEAELKELFEHWKANPPKPKAAGTSRGRTKKAKVDEKTKTE